jgi:hypothetical protein
MIENGITGEVEICRIYDCPLPAEVIVGVELVHMDSDGIEDLGVQSIAMCHQHSVEEQS